MALRRIEHLGIVVSDLQPAIAFFLELGMEAEGRWIGEGEEVDRITGVAGGRADCSMLRTPDGQFSIELIEYLAPEAHPGDPGAPANTLGFRHLAFHVDDLDETISRLEPHGVEVLGGPERAGETWRLAYVRGPEGIILELAEQIG